MYAVIFEAKEYIQDGKVITEEGSEHWVVMSSGWCTSEKVDGKPPDDLVTWDTEIGADLFMLKWTGQLAWVQTNGVYRVVRVYPTFKTVPDGWATRL